ncbi:MAG: PIN domain-containing protein [Candidatus Wallbacteria bacterium]|nr:PIN domain-containing protein [Candidatus Wallbacteria bacterium]
MKDKLFLDTNILVYLANEDADNHEEVKTAFSRIMKEAELWISTQVLREYAVVMTRTGYLKRALKPSEAVEDIEKWLKIFKIAGESPETTAILLNLIKKYDLKGKRIHDANIVASMIETGIKKIFTYNRADFAIFKEIKIIKN